MGRMLASTFVNKEDQKQYGTSTVKTLFGNNWETAVFAKDEWKPLGNKPLVKLRTDSEDKARQAHQDLTEVLTDTPRWMWQTVVETMQMEVAMRSMTEYLEKRKEGGSRSSSRKVSAISALAIAIITKSQHCTASLKDVVKGATPTKYMDCFLEFVYFFAHIVNVLIFGSKGLGEQKGRLVLNKLGPNIAELTYDVVAGGVTALGGELPEKEFMEGFYKALNQTELEYSNCETAIATLQEERTTVEIIASGKTRKGRINQLADRVTTAIEGSPLSFALNERIKDLAVEALTAPPHLTEYVRAAGQEV